MDIGSDGRAPCIITVRGRFDANEVDTFNQFLDRLRASGISDVSVDLSAVNFIDSSALASLVAAANEARADGRLFELRDPSDPVRVILELTGLDKAFAIRDRRGESAATP